jgi:hypothetical protein
MCVGSAQAGPCSDALVISTYDRFETKHVDWRLASHVFGTAYNEIRDKAGASATIYGVPVGANYGDFKGLCCIGEKSVKSRQKFLAK